MINIVPIETGIPVKTATKLMVRVMSFETDSEDLNFELYFEVCSNESEILSSGNIKLTPSYFISWPENMESLKRCIENLALSKLGLVRIEQ